MRSPGNTNILLDNDGKNEPMTSVDPTTCTYVSRPQRLARRLVGDSVSRTLNSSDMRSIGTGAITTPPTRLIKDVDDHVFGTTLYDMENPADGSLATQRCDSRTSGRTEGGNAHLLSEPPSPPRFPDMHQQQQAQQSRSITPPTAAMESPLWGTEGAAAAVKCSRSGPTTAVPDLQTEGTLLTPHPPSHSDQHGAMASGDGELTSQKLLRFAPYAPSHRSPHITHTSPAAKPERPLIPPPPAPPSAAPPSGLCSPGRLAQQQSPQRLSRSPYSQQKQLRQLCNSSCSEEAHHSSAAAVAPLASLSRGIGALSSTKRRCIGHSMSRRDASRSRIDNAEGVLTRGRVITRSPLAKGSVTRDVCAVPSKRAEERHEKEVVAAPDCVKDFFTAAATILESPGPRKHEKLSTGSQAPTQGPMSPTSHGFPKGCESPLRMSNPHSLESSTWENWSKSVTSNATTAFLDVVPAETPAAAAPVGLSDRASARVVGYVTDAQRESASTRLLEVNVSALFNGSSYSALRVSTEHHVLRALPAVQTSIDNAAIEAAIAVPPTVERPAPKKAARVSLTRTPTWKTLALMRDASRYRDSELTLDAQGVSVMGQPPSRVPHGLFPVRGPSLGGNHKRRHGEHPRRAAEPAPRTSPTFSMPESTGRKEFVVDSSATLQDPIPGIPQQPGRMHLSNTSSGVSRDKRDGVSRRIHEDVVSILKVRSSSVSNRSTHQHQQPCPSMGCARHVGTTLECKYDGENHDKNDAVAVGKPVVPAVSVSRVLLSKTFPPMPELRDMQTGALRFHSVLQGDEGQECRHHAPPPRSSSESLVEAEEEWSVEQNTKIAAEGNILGDDNIQVADEIFFMTLRQNSENSATADNVCSQGDTGFTAHSRPNCNPSLSTTTPAISYSVTSRMRPSVCEAGMRRIHSDVCFGTFISVLNSTRSSLDDYQTSSCLGDTTNELDGPLDAQATFFSATALAPSAPFVSPNGSKTRARRDYGSSGSSSNPDWQHHKRKSCGRAWPSSSVASRICRAHRDDDAATNSDRCSCSTSSHGMFSSRTSILSFAFGDENSAVPVGEDTSRRGSTASNKFDILQTCEPAYSPQTMTEERRHLAALSIKRGGTPRQQSSDT